MKAFEFVAFDSSGKKKVGKEEAWSLLAAKRKIQQRGFYLASIKIQDSSVGFGVFASQIHSGSSGIKSDGSRGTYSRNQNSFSFFRWLIESFFSKERIDV